MAHDRNVVALQDHARAKLRAADGSAPALDVVARLFDHIGADAGIAEAARVQLARLRIPTLRAAQIERDFLVNRAHPARRLIDAICAAAAGLDENARSDDPTAAALALAVHQLLTDFDADLAPFEAGAARVAQFVEERTRAEDALARRIAQEIEARERDREPQRAGAEQVARRLRARLWVPQPVRDMLLGPWTQALAATYRAEGEGSAWHALLRTTDDLLWSVEPKASPEGRRRLAAMLPSLIEALADGLRRGEVADDAREAFLSALVDCHAHAVKAGMRGLAAVPEAPEQPAQAPAFARETFAVGDRRVEEIRLAGALEWAAQGAPAGPGARLRPGAWIEIERGARSAARKRLAWASPITGVCLFVGVSPTSAALAISPAALAEQMRRGEVRVVDDAPLVERALAALLAGLAPA